MANTTWNARTVMETAISALSKEPGGSLRSSTLGPAASKVYLGIRAQIISLELLPYATLARAKIAEDYGVSQSPVREALQQLEQEGLVLSYPQSRTIVAKIDVEHARETRFLRLAVELEVGRSLAKDPGTDWVASARRILAMQKLGRRSRYRRVHGARQAFSRLDVRAARVPSLDHLISSRSGHVDRLRRLNLPDPGKIAAVLQGHHEILTAISNRDIAGTEKAIRDHLPAPWPPCRRSWSSIRRTSRAGHPPQEEEKLNLVSAYAKPRWPRRTVRGTAARPAAIVN